MNKTSKIILASILVLTTTSAVFAFGKHHYSHQPFSEKAEKINKRVSSKLELNNAQQAKLTQLTDQVSDILQQQKPLMKPSKMLGEFISDQPLDQTALLNRINQKTALVNQHAPEVVALFAGFVDSLDSEQKAKMKKMLLKHRGHKGGFEHRKGSQG